MVAAVAGRAVAVAPPPVPGEQPVQHLGQVALAARAQLEQGHPGGGVRHEHVHQAVAPLVAETFHLACDVGDQSIAGPDVQLLSLHALILAQRPVPVPYGCPAPGMPTRGTGAVSSVAVVGLGGMGRAMAVRLLATGHEVVVWNRSPGPVEDLAADGALAAATPADAARRAEFVIVMVSDPDALRDVTEGQEGILAGAPPGTSLLQMATVGPEAVARLADQMPHGVELVDCPVLGSLSEAEGGTLAVFVGGDHRRAEPVLSSLGRIVPCGPIGAGSAAKLVANSTLFGVLGVLGEAVALGDGLGLSREATFEVLSATPIAAQAERRRDGLQGGERPLRFTLALAGKDADLVAEAGTAAGLTLPVAAAARGWLDDAVRAGRGGEDYSAVLAHIAGPPSG